MAIYLPERYRRRYRAAFAKKFLICVSTADWKHWAPENHALVSVAEEPARNAIISRAEVILESQGAEAYYADFYDDAFDGDDFRFLFDPAWDGLEDSIIGQHLGVSNLQFDEWFKPKDDADVHPWPI